MNSKIDALKLLPLRLGVARVSMGLRFLLSTTVVATYMVASRMIFNTESLSFAEVEALRTPFRLVAAVLLWLLMADVLFSLHSNIRPLRRVSAVIGISLLFAAPILTYDYEVSTTDAALLAISSFPVALFEEMFFRGIVQTLLVKATGAAHGIAIGTIIFTLFHLGATTPDTLNFILIFLSATIYGIVYFRTGSLLAVVLLHAVDDVLTGLPLAPVLPLAAGIMLPFLSALIFLHWAKGSK